MLVGPGRRGLRGDDRRRERPRRRHGREPHQGEEAHQPSGRRGSDDTRAARAAAADVARAGARVHRRRRVRRGDAAERPAAQGRPRRQHPRPRPLQRQAERPTLASIRQKSVADGGQLPDARRGGRPPYDRRRHASAAPEPDRVPADHDRRRGAAGDHHRHRRRRAPDGLGSRVPVVAELPEGQLTAHGAVTSTPPVDRVAQPDVHRPRVGRGDRRGARQPACASRSATDLVWLSLGPGRRRVRAGGARRAHGRCSTSSRGS